MWDLKKRNGSLPWESPFKLKTENIAEKEGCRIVYIECILVLSPLLHFEEEKFIIEESCGYSTSVVP